MGVSQLARLPTHNPKYAIQKVTMGDYKIYLGNIPDDCREKDVEKFFKGYGKIRHVVLKGNYGFAEFDDLRDAQDAVKDLDGCKLLGTRIRVEPAWQEDRLQADRGEPL